MVILFYAIAIAVFQAAFGQGVGQVILTTVRCMVISLHTIAIAVSRAAFGQGTGPVLLNYVGCTGNESSLLSCSHEVAYCSHYFDAGVVCPSCKSCI